MKKNFEKTAGITLIALVVTIVVLIILAVISINTVFGEGGIIARAEQAEEEHRAGSVQEEVGMWKDEKLLAKYDGSSVKTRDELIDDQLARGLLTDEEAVTAKETGSVKIASQTINYGDDDVTTGVRTLVEMYDAGELKIGDYINFPNPTSGTYTSSASQTGYSSDQTFSVANNQLNWRILGKDEATGGLKLIAGSPMKVNGVETSNNPYFYMYGAEAYINGITELNNIAGLYANEYTTSARSVNMDDINSITGVTTEAKIKEVNLDYYYGWKQYGDTYSFASQYTPESYLNGETTTTVSGTVDGYYYSVNSQVGSDAPYVTMTDTRAYSMLFDNVTYGSGKAYWLASRGVYAGSSYAGFGPAAVGTNDDGVACAGTSCVFYSDGYEVSNGFAVRPVVILKSGVTEEDMQKIPDQTEETWNFGTQGQQGPPPQEEEE